MISITDAPPSAYVDDGNNKQKQKADVLLVAASASFTIQPDVSPKSSQIANTSSSQSDIFGEFSRVLAAHDTLTEISEEESVHFVGNAFKATFGSRAPLLDLHSRTLAGLGRWSTRTDTAKTLRDLLRQLYHQTHRIAAVAHLFDFPNQPGNGYWTVCKSFVRYEQCLLIQLTPKRNLGLLKRSARFLDIFLDIFKIFDEMMRVINIGMDTIARGQQDDPNSAETAPVLFFPLALEEHQKNLRALDVSSFYGRFCGAHYSPRVRNVFNLVATANTAFITGYESANSKSLRNLIGAAMFLPTVLNKDQRGRKMNRFFHNTTVESSKFWWNKSERAMRHAAKFLSPITAVNKRMRVSGVPINMGDGVVVPLYRECSKASIASPGATGSVVFRVISYLPLHQGVGVAPVLKPSYNAFVHSTKRLSVRTAQRQYASSIDDTTQSLTGRGTKAALRIEVPSDVVETPRTDVSGIVAGADAVSTSTSVDATSVGVENGVVSHGSIGNDEKHVDLLDAGMDGGGEEEEETDREHEQEEVLLANEKDDDDDHISHVGDIEQNPSLLVNMLRNSSRMPVEKDNITGREGAAGGLGFVPVSPTGSTHMVGKRKQYDGILVHFHGGGFVAHSSRSHQVYLRRWSADLKLTIISVDYTTAPEGRFPKALDECFFVYCLARKFKHLFGCSENGGVYVTGDSAGANLSIAVALRAQELGVTPPDGICSCYGVVNTKMAMSPSRGMALCDGLLNVHTLLMCLDSYCETTDNPLDIHNGNPQLSPWHASDQQLANLPPMYMAACELDPLLDDSVAFAVRLKGLVDKGLRKASLDFTVLQGCPHGFLNLLGCGDSYVERAERTVFELLSSMLNATKTPRKRWRR